MKKRLLTFILAALMLMTCFMGMTTASVAAAEGDSETLNGWTLGEGYSVDGVWVYEGSYSLKHTGAESQASMDAVTLAADTVYFVTAYVRAAEGAKVKIDFAGQQMVAAGTGKWEKLNVNVMGDGSASELVVTAEGEAYIDGISVRPFQEGEELFPTGTFDTQGWGSFTWVKEWEGKEGVITSNAGGVSTASGSVGVEPDSWYSFSADIYLTAENNPPWAYIDMNDSRNEVQLRGTKAGEWQTVMGLWYSGSNSSTPIRFVKENNWDNPNASGGQNGAVYVDNVSFKQVTVDEDCVLDESFETSAAVLNNVQYEWITVNTTDKSVTADASTNKSNYEDPGRAGCPAYIGDDSMNIQEWAEFKFTGTAFKVIAGCSMDCTAVDIYIDGAEEAAARVDLGELVWQTKVIYESEELAEGEHTVRLVPALRGENIHWEDSPYANKDFTRTYCGIDAFEYKTKKTDEVNADSVWKLDGDATIITDSYYLYGKSALAMKNESSAVANNGKAITVKPNTYYYLTAMTFRPGNKDIEGYLRIKDAEGKEVLYDINPTRYNQTRWDTGWGNMAEQQVGHWEQVGGMWYSGENTEITLWVETEGIGTYYFDQVALNGYENRAPGKNIFADGDMEGYIPDAVDLKPTDLEKARVKEQYESFLANDLANFPTTFTLGNKTYTGFGTDFTKKSQTTEDVYSEAINANVGVKTITEMEHTSGLIFRVESVFYEAYNAYDWTIYAVNNTESNSLVLKNWDAIDYTWEGEAPKLNGTIGDHSAYQPYAVNVDGVVTKSSGSGRGTSGDSSYFNFQYGDKGIMMAVGWPGYWDLTLDNSDDPNLTKMTAGQVEVGTYLKPGEEFRTPLMAFVHYNGRNADRCTNLWRSWMIDCNVNTITDDPEGLTEEKLPEAGIYAATSIQWHEMTRATTENQITAISYYLDHGIDLTYWWMDAGWYYKIDGAGNFQMLDDWGWTATGAWVADADRFGCRHEGQPHGPLWDISDFAEQNGIRTLLWFEPERIANEEMLIDDATDRVHYSDNTTIHPSWIIKHPSGSWPILDMGNEDAVAWMLNRIITVMEEGGIDMYREDFNTDPIGNWRNADSMKGADRKGITENLYIQGHLGMWDDILEHFPNATIDSCASGGNRNDLESMRRGVPLHKTDHAYGDQKWQQNSAAYFQKWVPILGTKANGESEASDNTTTANRYALRSALVGGMVLGYNTDAVSAPVDWDIIEDITEEHKDIMHLVYSDYYVLEDWSGSDSDWSAWEYFDVELNEGCVLAFRRESAEATKVYNLKGLDKETTYKVWFEDANKPVYRTGIDLMKNGVEFNIPVAGSSDILHIQAEATADADRALTTIVSEASYNGQYQGAIYEIDNINLDKYNPDNGERTLYETLKTKNAGYNRFDIRFNMNLRDTLLAANAGTVEYGVTDDYVDLMTIDGETVADILAKDSEAVYMDYDAFNNILNVYVAESLFDGSQNHVVALSSKLESDGGAMLEGNVTYTFNAAKKAWTEKVTEPGEVEIEEIVVDGADRMVVGDTQQLTVEVLPEEVEDKAVEWSSSDAAVVAVDANGVVTAKATGNAVITATAADGSGVEGNFTIYVDRLFAAPTNVKAVSQGYNSLKVSWAAVEGAEGYRVYRADEADGEYALIYTAAAGKLSVNNLNRVTGKPYYYKVAAIAEKNGEVYEGDLSAAKVGKAVPKKPANVKTSSVSATTIKVSWDAVAGAKGYKLYASKTGKDGSFYLSYTTNDPAKTSVNVLNRETGKTYYFKVRAISEYDGAVVSGTLSAAVTGKAIPATPVVTISKASDTSIRNKWKAVYGADGYEVYRSLTGKAGTFYLQKRTEYLSYANTKLKAGQTYYYKVRAYKLVDGKRVYGNFSTVKSYTL